ncbi:MAG: hypothetical protein HOP24_12260 [Sideroxydans sp.]|nr:hypothetical protein [Sideroxydans sp.]
MVDATALSSVIRQQSSAFQAALTPAHAHLFSEATVQVAASHVAQMRAVIAAVEEALAAPNQGAALGVFYGYDFHLNAEGAHLIEINTNAGGAFLNTLLLEPQQAITIQTDFLEMFRHEWRLVRGDAPLKCIAIVDEQPTAQFLYPEFLLAQHLFEQAGIRTLIAAPSELHLRSDGIYCHEQRVDLIYNRLTDFDLQHAAHLREAWAAQQLVCTPNPTHHQRYADKRQLAWLTDRAALLAAGIAPATIEILLRGIPQTKIVRADAADVWWTERKQWFFKPMSGYGSKGAYRGDKLTKRVFEEIMQADYVAQRLAVPGECAVSLKNGETTALKYDLRCYVYNGHIQLMAARLYQGQTTNFRTEGGGFARVIKL